MSHVIRSSGQPAKYEVFQAVFNPKRYRCHLAIIREEDGAFSAVVLNLPGAGSCGDTEAAAVANAREAASAVIAEYLDSEDGAIPWLPIEQYEIPEDAKQKWIVVDG